MATQNATSPAALPLISDMSEKQILAALAILHGEMLNYGPSALPALESIPGNREETERVFARALKALTSKHTAREEAAVAQFRTGVTEALTPYIEEARAQRTYAEAAPQAFRAAMVALLPTHVTVPVSVFADIFPAGTTMPHMVKMLKSMSYTVAKVGDDFAVKAPIAGK
jgi:hypothetical protein